MTTRSRIKTEHAGAKNGGGYWGMRVEAKAESRVKRRHDDRAEVEEQTEQARDDPQHQCSARNQAREESL